MFQKLAIAVLTLALLGVSAAWGYSEWSRRPATPKIVAPPPTAKPTPVATMAPPAHAPEAETEAAEGTRFLVEYVAPRDEALLEPYRLARDVDLFTRLPEVRGLSGMLVLPRPLKLLTAECRQVNAFYNPDKAEVVLCYEMIDTLLRHGHRLQTEKQLDDGFAVDYLRANLRFIVLHELGHALIDQLDLSTTGREEDAADQLATMLMLRAIDPAESPEDVARQLQMAANFFVAAGGAEAGYDLGHFADEHSLGEQRYFNTLCLLYGSDPGRYLRVVTRSGLPEERALRCPDESRRVTGAWARLLMPHIAPKYRMSADEGAVQVAELRRQQAENGDSPYVRGDEARARAPAAPSEAEAPVDAPSDGGRDGNPYTEE
ncbi:DUF4344 domain-containing metallopeptidase [Lysobacter humi (ex Lee et al. 2017)]